jgi:two-component system, response regulator PdtaR
MSRTVLVVEDEALIRFDLCLILEDAGFDVLQAGSADEAIGVLEANPAIGAVFTDINMPGSWNGLQLAHYVRKRWPPTILILCSGNEKPDHSVMPSRTSFLAKPYDWPRLQDRIRLVGAELDSRVSDA